MVVHNPVLSVFAHHGVSVAGDQVGRVAVVVCRDLSDQRILYDAPDDFRPRSKQRGGLFCCHELFGRDRHRCVAGGDRLALTISRRQVTEHIPLAVGIGRLPSRDRCQSVQPKYSLIGGHQRTSTDALTPGLKILVSALFRCRCISLCNSSVSVPYWEVEEVKPVHIGIDEATATIGKLLEDAVRSHMVSDVPIGVFLSGGIDSSCITAYASRHHHGRLKTYTVGFDFDKGVNELKKAQEVARRFDTDHHELHVRGYSLPHVIERLVKCHDEPFADSANIPLYLLCEELAGSPRVILQGDGGDEIFAGYRRYNFLAFERFWRLMLRPGLWVNGLLPCNARQYQRARFLRSIGNSDSVMQMAMLLTVETREEAPTRILTVDWQQELARYDPFARYRELSGRLAHLDSVQRMLYMDSKIILPDTFLDKVDKATMAHSIEARVPMLDYRLTEYVMGLPSSLKVRWGQKKWILRRALRGIVPDHILDAPKTGFGVPYSYWLRGPLKSYLQSVLFDPAILQQKVFDVKAISACMKEHHTGKRDNGFLLWKALNLALWCKTYQIDLSNLQSQVRTAS